MSLHETISSLYDDELDVTDQERIIDSLKQSEQKQVLGRYSIIGEAMRRNLPNNPDHDLFSRVQSALETEPALLAPLPANMDKAIESTDSANVVELPKKPSSPHSSYRPIAGFAVAASVALASVLGFQMFSQPADVFSNNVAQPLAAVSAPATQTLDIAPSTNVFAENVAFSAADEPVGDFGDVTYAQQSLTDDGQWTRITRIGDVLLDDNLLTRPPEFRSSAGITVGLKKEAFPFAHATNLDSVRAE